MIETLTLINWKSFHNASLYIEPLTFIIGYNASGKSNILEALSCLSFLAKGYSLDDTTRMIRGGEDWLIFRNNDSTTLQIKVFDDDTSDVYDYRLVLGKRNDKLQVVEEELSLQHNNTKTILIQTNTRKANESLSLPLSLYTGKTGRRRGTDVLRDHISLLTLALLDDNYALVSQGAKFMLNKLRNIFFINPIPSMMRHYVPLQTRLKEDASNIAGVIAGIEDPQQQQQLQEKIAQFVRSLPERDIVKVWTEKVGLFQKDAMLYCEEQWTNEETLTVDARGMSDGTLRFLAIITALLTLPPHTLLLIEEVDNGLHPSRAKALIAGLKEIGSTRQIDVLCTTHNPTLIDALGNEMISCISYISRNSQDGSSDISLLQDNDNLVEIMASGGVGASMINGKL